jgi:hypothetical protein
MTIRLSPSLLLPAVLGAAVAAFLMVDRSSSSAAPLPPADTTAAAETPDPAGAPSVALPPNHPAIGGMTGMSGMSGHGPHGGSAMMPNAGANPEPPGIVWTAPPSWQTSPNPNAMRLATYKVGDGSELSVARAGGSVDANVQRWTAQFDGTPRVDRSDKQVHGLKVTVVRIGGTFLGGGMSASAPEKHDGWAMVAAIVESTGSPYFFKLIGPSDQVDRARAAFDALVSSIAPRTSE